MHAITGRNSLLLREATDEELQLARCLSVPDPTEKVLNLEAACQGNG